MLIDVVNLSSTRYCDPYFERGGQSSLAEDSLSPMATRRYNLYIRAPPDIGSHNNHNLGFIASAIDSSQYYATWESCTRER